MKVQFLGGADEVGASSTLVEIAGHRILVDCGIRMKDRGGTNLPDLSQIQKGGIEAVVLTHTHIDHCGALPVIYQLYDIPLYLTPPTLSLMSIMLLDALNVMQMEMEREIPLYSVHEVEKVIAATRPVPFKEKMELFGGEVRLTFYPCGHILGAASVLLEGDGSLFISGDISVTDQLTVSGMKVPPLRPDLVVIESTYGGKLHADRKQEERRLVEQAARIMAKRGRMLIPAFAVGRAQELILILAKAMEKRELPEVPVIVDGLVRSICKVYGSYPNNITLWLKRRIKKYGNPFFPDGRTIFPVQDPHKRAEYAQLRPAIIVSSSGMLAGGPSQMYARELAGDPESYIAITGYQDEEAPGRRLQEIAEAGKGEVQLGEAMVDLQCGIGTYSLSAHADTAQLLGVLKALKARDIVLVHGESTAREELERAAQRSGIPKIYRPQLGEEIALEVPGKKRRLRRKKAETEEKIGPEQLMELAEMLVERDGAARPYTIQELLVAWDYSALAITLEEIERVRQMLVQSPFKQDSRKQFLYRVRRTPDGKIVSAREVADVPGRWEQNKTTQRIEEIFPKDSGLYKKSFRPEENSLVLSFCFPKVAGERFVGLIEQLAQETKWKVTVSPHTHESSLRAEIRKAVPPDWPLKKNPSLFMEEGKAVVQIAMDTPPLENAGEAIQKFKEITGFDLVILGQASPSLKQSPQGGDRLEINRAYAVIRAHFQNLPHQPLKMSMREGAGEGSIELAFLSPQLGEIYRDDLQKLGKDTGWPLQIKPQPDQHRIKQLAGKLVPASWEICKGASFYEDRQLVVVHARAIPDQNELAAITEEFRRATGYHLAVEVERD